MTAAGLPCGELREIHRNAGTIVRVCSAIVDGLPWEPDERIDMHHPDGPRNLVLLPASKATAPQVVCNLLETLRDSSPFDSVWDCQVLVATNDMKAKLNAMLQQQQNPNPGIKGTPFRLDDKVIFLSNTELPFAVIGKGGESWKPSDEKARLCNGDMGRVVHAVPKLTVVQFASQERPTLIYRGGGAGGDDEDEEGPPAEGKNAKASGKQDPAQQKKKTNTGCDLDLAFAITTHRSQGSQWPVAIYLIEESQVGEYGNVDRSHVYTGISRAQKATFIVGQKWAVNDACRRTFIDRRQTYMAEQIRIMAAKAGVGLTQGNEVGLW
jgi:ATP-dependent exoDNAse (exonuclease V) alpha subunit